MGIPSYFSDIVKRHKNIVKRLGLLPRIHNLYMDTNGLIYDAVRIVGSNRGMSDDEYETMLINMVCEKITEYVKMIRPESKVFIAFDGVAPVAKLNQQRERRYKSWFTTIVEQTINRKAAAALTGGTGTGVGAGAGAAKDVQTALQKAWNTSSITPGTRFMTKLNTRMREYLATQAYTGVGSGTGPEYIYSGSDTVGEGEHKIFEYIRAFPGYHRDTTTLIYGLDADLIMLCLNHLHISENIFLYRDTPEFIQSLDNTLSKDDHYFLDIPTFACSLEVIMRETKTSTSTTPATGSTSTAATITTTAAGVAVNVVPETRITPSVVAAIDDYILMTFMLGNDFMPHFPSLNLRTIGMTILLQTYADVFRDSNQYLVKRSKDHVKEIVWKSMRTFIERLAANEHELLMNEHKTRDKQSRRFGGSGGGGDRRGDNHFNSNKSNINPQTGVTGAASLSSAKVDMTELTGVACGRVIQMVSSVDKCHTMSDFMSIPMQERATERYIDPFRENWEYRYYDALFDIDLYTDSRGSHRVQGGGGGGGGGGSGVDRVRMICVNYIEGLEWTMRYYSTGCVDWRWTYKYPYAPLLNDLVRYIPHTDTAMFTEGALPNPVRDLVQLCYVLPMSGHGLLPPAVAEKLKREYSHYYCDKLEFKWSYCKYFWEAHTELPHIRIADLEEVVGGYR
jgi:5'-3' exonuclease